ncbi:uncharacterized protein N7459_001978 [Penicillium hispanicum]|uniref:uncharacterized protein n=1 Tax=Penicillium hispanicum TaxID=1080232 RepID=UPI002541BB69|nr:uncharacterized protein N7459_001978 [Penicillium hispanicum]KAJ5591609.1 hypothetical protein N7459_001978 [Penicillium hispanicum]
MYGSDWPRRLLGMVPTLDDSPSYDFQTLSSILSVSQELDHQLEAWFDLLPPTIKPNMTDPSQCSPSQLIMLHRFYSAKDIILRPFLLCAVQVSPEEGVPPMVLEQCKHSLANSRIYLDTSVRRLRAPTSNAEMIIDT